MAMTPAKKPKPTAKKAPAKKMVEKKPIAKKATAKKTAAKPKPKGKTEDQLWGPAKKVPMTMAEKRAAVARKQKAGIYVEPADMPGFAFGKKTN